MSPKSVATANSAPKKADPAAPAKPTYAVMVKKAIVELKERTGSSIPAISNYITANFGGLNKTALVAALKKGVEDETLVKVKASYKLGVKGKLEPKPMKKVIVKKKPAPRKESSAAKPKKTIKKKTKAGPTGSKKAVTKKKFSAPMMLKAPPKKKVSSSAASASVPAAASGTAIAAK